MGKMVIIYRNLEKKGESEEYFCAEVGTNNRK